MKVTLSNKTVIVILDKEGKKIEMFIPEMIQESKGALGHTLTFTKDK